MFSLFSTRPMTLIALVLLFVAVLCGCSTRPVYYHSSPVVYSVPRPVYVAPAPVVIVHHYGYSNYQRHSSYQVGGYSSPVVVVHIHHHY